MRQFIYAPDICQRVEPIVRMPTNAECQPQLLYTAVLGLLTDELPHCMQHTAADTHMLGPHP